MTPQQLHEKRRKRTSLKKADQYRAKMAFWKQRYLTILKDFKGEEAAKNEAKADIEIMKSSKAELQHELIALKKYVAWLQRFWLTRVVLFFFKPKSKPTL